MGLKRPARVNKIPRILGITRLKPFVMRPNGVNHVFLVWETPFRHPFYDSTSIYDPNPTIMGLRDPQM